MTDERLAEIEAYCGIDGPWVRVVDGCTFTFHDPPRDIVNQRWLLSRVRELEAQAAVNNAAENVVTQASTLTPWEWRHVAQRLWTERGSSKETAAMTALAIALEFYEKKRAALAAREEAE